MHKLIKCFFYKSITAQWCQRLGTGVRKQAATSLLSVVWWWIRKE